MNVRIRTRLIASSIGVMTALACGPTPEGAEGRDEVSTTEDPLSVYSPGTRQTSVSIPVCFNSNVPLGSKRTGIRSNIEGTWAVETGVTFVGWDTCSALSSDVSIKHEPLSHNGFGVLNSIGLNLDAANLMEASIHEMGHILGFQHEQASTGTPATCTQQQFGEWVGFNESVGGGLVTPWDALSVMNYCRTFKNTYLSPWDIAGSGLLYGPPNPIAAASWGPGRIDAFALQPGNSLPSHRRLWHYATNDGGATWSNEWFDISYLTSGVTVAARQQGVLDLFGRDGSGKITWRNYTSGSGWSGWTQLSGVPAIEGTPTAVVLDASTVVVAARTARLNASSGTSVVVVKIVNGVVSAPIVSIAPGFYGEATGQLALAASFVSGAPRADVVYRSRIEGLRHFRFDLTSMTSSDVFVGAPALVGSSPSMVSSAGKLEVVFREAGATSTIHHGTFANGAWSFQVVGGVVLGNPSLVSWAPGRLDIVVRGTGNGLFHASRSPGLGWSGYSSLGGVTMSSPAIVVPPVTPGNEPAGLTVMAIGQNMSAWATSWRNQGGYGWSGLQNLGGYIR